MPPALVRYVAYSGSYTLGITIDTLNFMDVKRTSIRNDIRRGCTPLIAALQRFEEMILRGSFRAPTVVAPLIQRLF